MSILSSLVSGVGDDVAKAAANKGDDIARAAANKLDDVVARKAAQFDLLQRTNPMLDNYHTGIRSAKEINRLQDLVDSFDADSMFTYPDFTIDNARAAVAKGTLPVFSSKPIEPGVFVSPSKMMAADYAGGDASKVFSKEIPLDDFAAILSGDEGNYLPIASAKNGSALGALLSGENVATAVGDKADGSISPALSKSAQTVIDRYNKRNWTPDTENSLFEDIYDVLGDDNIDAGGDVYNELLSHYGLKPVATPKGDDFFLVPEGAEFTGASGANDLFDEAANYFSPNVETSRSWGSGDVPSRYIPFFDEQIRIANHNNSYSHPYGLIFDNDSLYKGRVPLQDVKNGVLEEMRRAIDDDNVVENWLDDRLGYQTMNEALEDMAGNFTPDFMEYRDGELSALDQEPLKITDKTRSDDISYYLYDALRNKKFALAGLLGGGSILGALLGGGNGNTQNRA